MKKILLTLALFLIFPIYVLAHDTFIQSARDGDMVAVQEYLNSGGDVNAKNPYGGTAIMFASRAGHVEIAKLLLDAGADVNVHGNYAGTTALMWASQYESKEIVKLLIEAHAEINAKNHQGQTALYFALENGNTEIVQILQNAGAK